MRYSITSNCKNFTINREKNVFRWEKWNLELTENSAHTAAFATLFISTI